MGRHLLLAGALLLFMFSCSSVSDGTDAFIYHFTEKATKLPTPTATRLPSSWKGFNALNMFYFGSTWGTDMPFAEEEFKMMSEWGFNLVRIPIDYRILIRSNNWNHINEAAVQRIDKAVEYGIKYDMHICLNFHRAPGYTVASPPETTDLWTQKEPQEVFARLWGFLARRYKHIPNEFLSFNFVNEPPDMDEAVYAAIIAKAADAIWAHDPNRLLIADGLAWGRKPSTMIKDLGIAQATRGYEPFGLTHYKAEWVDGSQDYALPMWPTIIIPQFLYGLGKTEVPRSVFSIEHDFNEAYNLDVNIGIVSGEARLIVKADGNILYNRLFISGPGTGEWNQAVYNAEWNVYQNIFNKDYRMEIPAGTQWVTLEVTDGDWMSVNNMHFSAVSKNGAAFHFSPNHTGWGEIIPHVAINTDGTIVFEDADTPRTWLWETYFKPWEDIIKSGGGVMVGEWGVYNKTPHDVVLRWMEDNLKNFQDAGIGWALWNFNGSFGVINSERDDVHYENIHGYRLDREMLQLLLQYQ